ncbi:polyprenyl synthetase family protein [Bifidobacterium sp. 82T24]|uniref:polyprenyl synthetase family protein n=1 Tax=Bifidobacterium pluvialisilvae TaxID=2834436 RepID=UPI001C55A3A3|nr:polyprenyl synthetase family protein [Bifidobacterium pluvialisilvae]MBW3087368.1 polyprenyl synthetase family protein [Bifidobacterium pluvialisilvae]
MTTRNRIEHRIGELIVRLCDAHSDDLGSATSEQLCRAVADQALVSSRGGKRLRALLLMTFHDALRGTPGTDDDAGARGALDLACAIEVFQTAALVHDDIIDDADMRRGRPAAHKALESFCAAHSPTSAGLDAAAMGGGLGIMLGDLLATASVAIVNEATATMPHHGPILDRFLAMHRDVEIGQVMDLAAERMPLDDPSALASNALAVFRWKTASYTTVAPIELALLAAGVAPGVSHETAREIGVPLGTAFQLADDLLDVVADPAVTGKPVGGDIREGKRTVLLADALDALDDADPAEAAFLRDRFSRSGRDDADVRRIIDAFVASGAVDRSRDRIARLWRRSESALDGAATRLGIATDGIRALRSVCARFVPEVLHVEISPA